jgi:hypothetical protein
VLVGCDVVVMVWWGERLGFGFVFLGLYYCVDDTKSFVITESLALITKGTQST